MDLPKVSTSLNQHHSQLTQSHTQLITPYKAHITWKNANRKRCVDSSYDDFEEIKNRRKNNQLKCLKAFHVCSNKTTSYLVCKAVFLHEIDILINDKS